MAKLKIGPGGLDLIKSFEELILYVYDDLVPKKKINGKLQNPEWDGSKPKGTLTIGYGHTNAAADPTKIKQDLRITEPQADTILDNDLDPCEADVNRLVKVELTQNQFDALCSFQFNTGLLKTSTLLKKLNAGNEAAVPAELMRFTKSKGKELAGLVRRRKAEVALWNQP
jgi:GH24 family phage-related lysozyme (muramidase)